jgi:hypothetical protein
MLDFAPESLQQVETVLARLHDMLKTAAPDNIAFYFSALKTMLTPPGA